MFTDSGKIYTANYSQSYSGLVSPKLQQISKDNILIHEVKTAADGILYAATNHGLYVVGDNIIRQINANFTAEVKHIYVDSNGCVWCGDAAGNVLKSPN